MTQLESTLVCQGCGYRIPLSERWPFVCPRAVRDDDVDHVLRRELRLDESEHRRLGSLFGPIGSDGGRNPFLHFRELFHTYRMALGHGLSDSDFVDVVRRLDRAIATSSASGLRETPCLRQPSVADALGCADVWVKDETGNVGGTHKGRHLVGLLIWLMLDELDPQSTGESRGESERQTLAISSCGNAALAASIAAGSVEWPIEVFVPTDARPAIVDRLRELRAAVNVCERRPDEAGDPCYLRFLERLAAGGLPFTCQGSSNGLVIEGGQTLIWEMISTLISSASGVDRLFIQTGGGALATACVTGWREACQVAGVDRLPAIHPVQTAAVAPLLRAYDRLVARIASRHLPGTLADDGAATSQAARAELAARLRGEVVPEAIAEELEYAVRHKSEFMWPWEGAGTSLADAILDDETYDWLPLVSGMLESGGYPVVVSESRLAEANALAHRATGINVSDTGSSGLAGALELAADGLLEPEERIGLLFTGVR